MIEERGERSATVLSAIGQLDSAGGSILETRSPKSPSAARLSSCSNAAVRSSSALARAPC